MVLAYIPFFRPGYSGRVKIKIFIISLFAMYGFPDGRVSEIVIQAYKVVETLQVLRLFCCKRFVLAGTRK
jgi:hypothetical protein